MMTLVVIIIVVVIALVVIITLVVITLVVVILVVSFFLGFTPAKCEVRAHVGLESPTALSRFRNASRSHPHLASPKAADTRHHVCGVRGNCHSRAAQDQSPQKEMP